jgi:hypothetical protein
MIQTTLAFLVQSLCGVVILAFLNMWLRRRSVNDRSLTWIYLSLLSWCAVAAMGLIKSPRELGLGIRSDHIRYIFSPVSSILFTMTAFRLYRVQDLFRTPHLQRYRRLTISFVIAASLGALGLTLLFPDSNAGKYVDAAASSVSLIALGLALAYSFHKYGNEWLVGLTLATLLGFIVRQYYLVQLRGDIPAAAFPLLFAGSTMLTMLFIALAGQWAFSDRRDSDAPGLHLRPRLRSGETPTDVKIIALSLDLRGVQRRYNADDFNSVMLFLDEFHAWFLSHALALPLGAPTLQREDRAFVWEFADPAEIESVRAIVGLTYEMWTSYPAWRKKMEPRFDWSLPEGIGAGVDAGPAKKITFADGSPAYLGPPIDMSVLLQQLARPGGGVVLRETVWSLLDGLRSKLPKPGKVRLQNSEILLRMSEDVHLPEGLECFNENPGLRLSLPRTDVPTVLHPVENDDAVSDTSGLDEIGAERTFQCEAEMGYNSDYHGTPTVLYNNPNIPLGKAAVPGKHMVFRSDLDLVIDSGDINALLVRLGGLGFGGDPWIGSICSEPIDLIIRYEGAGSPEEFLEKNDLFSPLDLPLEVPVATESEMDPDRLEMWALYPSGALRTIEADVTLIDRSIRAQLNDRLIFMDPDKEQSESDLSAFRAEVTLFAVLH